MPGVFNADTQVKLEIGFNSTHWSDTGSGFTWTDVTSYLRDFHTVTGRQFELDEVTAGTAEFVMINTDRRFDPTSTGGAYTGNIRPMRPIRFQAIHNGTTYDLWRGYVEGFTNIPELDIDLSVITAVDGFKAIAQSGFFSSTAPSEQAGARVSRFLNDAGFSTGVQNDSTGGVTVQEYQAVCSQLLTEINRVANTEGGLFYQKPDGQFAFDLQTARDASTSIATFTDTGGGLPYTEPLQMTMDDLQVWNNVEVSPNAGTLQSAVSTASQDLYGDRLFKRFDTLHANSTDAADLAQWMVDRYATPVTRIPTITFDPQSDTGLWQHTLGRGISDRITVRRATRSATTGVYSVDHHIEGITHAGTVEREWETTWFLSPST